MNQIFLDSLVRCALLADLFASVQKRMEFAFTLATGILYDCEMSDVERRANETMLRVAFETFRSEPVATDSNLSRYVPPSPIIPAGNVDPKVPTSTLEYHTAEVLLSLPRIPVAKRPLPTVAAPWSRDLKPRLQESACDTSPLSPPLIDAAASAAVSSVTPKKSTRLLKSRPSLSTRGLVPMSRHTKDQKELAYHELWFIVPQDYILPDGLHHSDHEREQPTEIPIRIFRPNVDILPTSVDELLIPAQDVGKLIGIRSGNISKDVIFKICGTTANDGQKASLGAHAWGQTMSAPTPSSTKCGAKWQPQKCIRVDLCLAFLQRRTKPAGVATVLRDGLKAYPIVSNESTALSASAPAPASASAAAASISGPSAPAAGYAVANEPSHPPQQQTVQSFPPPLQPRTVPPSVSADVLARAPPALRALLMSGGAGMDAESIVLLQQWTNSLSSVLQAPAPSHAPAPAPAAAASSSSSAATASSGRQPSNAALLVASATERRPSMMAAAAAATERREAIGIATAASAPRPIAERAPSLSAAGISTAPIQVARIPLSRGVSQTVPAAASPRAPRPDVTYIEIDD